MSRQRRNEKARRGGFRRLRLTLAELVVLIGGLSLVAVLVISNLPQTDDSGPMAVPNCTRRSGMWSRA